MEPVRHAGRQVDGGDGRGGQVVGVEYGRIAVEYGRRISAMQREWAEWAADQIT